MSQYDDQITDEVEGLVRPIYDQIKIWAHGWLHIEKVVSAAEDLAKIEGVDPVLCKIAAYCHDLGRLEEEQKGLVEPTPASPSPHAGFGIRPTEEVLRKVGIIKEDAAKIIEAVEIHNLRKYEGNNEIALILQDADRTNGFGKMGILRLAVFNCEIPIDEPRNEEDIDREIEQVKEILKSDKVSRDRMVETLKHVFEWVDVLANTKSLKNYVQEDYRVNRRFLEEIEKY